MAAIDFPNSPSVGQQFAASNGVTYEWTGVLWKAVASVIPSSYATTAPGGDIILTGTSNLTVMTLPSLGAAGQTWFVELTHSYYGGTSGYANTRLLANGTVIWETTIIPENGANVTVPLHWVGVLTGPTVFTSAANPSGYTGIHWNGDGSRLTAFRLP